MTRKTGLWCVGVMVCAVALAQMPSDDSPRPPKELHLAGDLIVNPSSEVQARRAVSKAQVMLAKAEAYLKSQQKPDGGWQGEKDPPAVTAIVLKAFVSDPNYSVKDDFIRKGYDKLLSYQLDNGGIYKDLLANYNTAIAISSLAAAKDESFKARIDKAVAYLKGLQWTQIDRKAPEGEKFVDQWYGGWGYGGRSRGGGRPDLSNVQMATQALHDAGLTCDDPAFQAAIKFINRQQNLSQTNDQPWASNDGGFVYGPGANGTGESMAGEYVTPDGQRRLRSYGSMTYAGLKSFIYAGVTKDDPRVKAALDWCRKNWTMDENPGMRDANPDWAHAGLYYYYMTLAKALRAYGQPIIETPDGVKHDWRRELIDALAKRQRDDGSWVGEARWMESNPVLVTAYATLALEDAMADLSETPASAE